jgi:putative ABC transport system permease protein
MPLLLGMRMVTRRPRRALLSVCSVAITVTAIVALLTLRARQAEGSVGTASAISNARFARVDETLLVLSVVLAVMAAINALFITRATVLDGRRTLTVARALGATPEEVGIGIAIAQLIPALIGAILGIPGGIYLLDAVEHGSAFRADPTVPELIAVVLGTLLAFAALTAVPARVGARRSVVEALQSETA